VGGMLKIGDILDGKYTVERLLNQGGFGRVWEAYDSILNKSVAIKELIDISVDQQESFLAEIQTLAALEHKNIIRIYHAIRHDEMLYLVMEFCKDGSLAGLLRENGTFSEGYAVDVAMAVCAGLQQVHNNGFVHHDIKPANILIGNDEAIKIGDFGVANTNVGTIYYLAPEQFEYDADPSDPRIDIYALGITIYQLLTGDVPFKGSRAQIINGHASKYPSFTPEIPHWLSQIILKAIAKEPELRFQTAEEFHTALAEKRTPPLLRPEMITASMWNADAEEWMSKGKWLKAQRRLEEGLRLYKEYPVAHANIGLCYVNIGLPEKALFHFEIAHSHQNPAVIKAHAKILIDNGEYGRAISMMSDYLYKHPLDFEGHTIHAKALFESGNFDLAAALFETLLSRKRNNPSLLNNLMISKYLAGQKHDVGTNGFPISDYNYSVIQEKDRSWNGYERKNAKSKLLFADYLESSRIDNVGAVSINDHIFAKHIVTIGRHTVNDLVIDISFVSRRHCVVMQCGAYWEIYDLDSVRGTFLNGMPVKGRRSVTAGGHTLTIANVDLKLHLVDSLESHSKGKKYKRKSMHDFS
jgi:serine/threonine protein kinase